MTFSSSSVRFILIIIFKNFKYYRFKIKFRSNIPLTILIPRVLKYYNFFADLKLLDYKVRILNTGTEATTRVLIESTDKTGVSWFTVGVSPNIIEASFKALIDSLDYKLYKEKAPANFNEK